MHWCAVSSARLLSKLLCVKAVARWQHVKSTSPPLLFIKAAFAGRLFTQFDTMHKLVLTFFILPKAFKMINQQAQPERINSYRQNEGIKQQRRRCLIFRQKKNKTEFQNKLRGIGPVHPRRKELPLSTCLSCITHRTFTFMQ